MNIALMANLDALHLRLQRAERAAADARTELGYGRQNLAIGTILDLETLLPECEALFRMVLMIHRSKTGQDAP